MMNFLTRKINLLGKTVLAAAAILGFLAFAGVPQASADRYDACQRRIVKAEHNVHQAVDRHGWNSKQADRARHNLREAREGCWNKYHRWWDEHDRRWHTDRDWDDRDHDRDRDRH